MIFLENSWTKSSEDPMKKSPVLYSEKLLKHALRWTFTKKIKMTLKFFYKISAKIFWTTSREGSEEFS